jgi:IclR-like helix-turn-helix domain-containing protein
MNTAKGTASGPPPWSAGAIAKAVDLNPAAVSRLVHTLEDAAFLREIDPVEAGRRRDVRLERLLAEAADVLRPVLGDVVVVGATALEVALADAGVAITPTRDVDVVVPVDRAHDVIKVLRAARAATKRRAT